MYVLARFGRDSCSAYIISGIISGAPSGSLSRLGQKHRRDAEKHTLPRNGLSRNGLSRVTSLAGRAAWLSHASSHTIYCTTPTIFYAILFYTILHYTVLCRATDPKTLGGSLTRCRPCVDSRVRSRNKTTENAPSFLPPPHREIKSNLEKNGRLRNCTGVGTTSRSRPMRSCLIGKGIPACCCQARRPASNDVSAGRSCSCVRGPDADSMDTEEHTTQTHTHNASRQTLSETNAYPWSSSTPTKTPPFPVQVQLCPSPKQCRSKKSFFACALFFLFLLFSASRPESQPLSPQDILSVYPSVWPSHRKKTPPSSSWPATPASPATLSAFGSYLLVLPPPAFLWPPGSF